MKIKKIKLQKENYALICILVLSAILNIGNLGLQGYGNEYYAAGVKSMTMNLKNFFFVSFDPAGFVSIDKPPLGFWIQAISAKIFGYSGWSILLPQAIAGVISVGLLYVLVSRAFGKKAGLISSLCMAVTPIFVAASKNNTIDNLLVMTLLFACILLSKAAENGKTKTLIFSLVLVGIGFNIKMLQAYMVAPAIYISYLLSKNIPLKKKIINLSCGTLVLAVVSLSWAFVVDLVPSSMRPYVGSSSNNTVMELIFGHNGIERFSSTSSGKGGAPGGQKDGKMEMPSNGENKPNNMTPPSENDNSNGMMNNGDGNSNNMTPPTSPSQNDNNSSSFSNMSQGNNSNNSSDSKNQDNNQKNFNGQMGPNGQKGPDGQGGPSGKGGPGNNKGGNKNSTFGGQEEASILRLFSNNGLTTQIVWFIPLAVLGFIAALISEKSIKTIENKKRVSLSLWILWLVPVFIFFSYTTGTFHPYYLTMLAPPVSALTGIGIVSMWKMYKESNNFRKFILPLSLIITGAVQVLTLSYDFDMTIAKVLIAISSIMTFVPAAILIFIAIKSSEVKLNIKRIILSISVAGLIITPLVCSSTTLFKKMQGSFPSAGLSLLSNDSEMNDGKGMGPMNDNNDSNDKKKDDMNKMNEGSSSNSSMIEYLKKNKGNAKYLVAAQSTNSLSNIVIESGESVMALGGFSGSDNILTLAQFKQMVKNGEIRFVMSDNRGGGPGNNEIMNWVTQNGKEVDGFSSLYDLKDAVN